MFFFGDGGLPPAETKRAKSTEKAGCPTCVLLLIDASFGKIVRPLRAIKLITYYIAQLLIALTILFF